MWLGVAEKSFMRQSFILQKSLLNPALRERWNAMLEPWGLIPAVTYRGLYGRICPAAALAFWTNPKPHMVGETSECTSEGWSGLVAEWQGAWEVERRRERFQTGGRGTGTQRCRSHVPEPGGQCEGCLGRVTRR